MLEQLLIKNFAIIEDLEIDFHAGFLCLCGETGSGKSIIIDALSLLLGERSSFDKIRFGKQKAYIEGVFNITNLEICQEISDNIDEEIENNLVVLSRSLDINGKSICKINSHAVSLSTLKKVSNLIIDIHSSQHDFSYLHEGNQNKLLDNYSQKLLTKEIEKIFNEYHLNYNEYLELKNELHSLNDKQNDLDSLDYLIYQKEELEKAQIKENEMEDLEEEKRSLAEFSKQSERIASFINDYQNASSSLYSAKKQLSYLSEEPFSSLNEKFVDLYYQLDDIFNQINDEFESKKDSLIRLEEINERLYFLHTLRKKYGYSTSDILAKYHEIKENIDDIANFENKRLKLESSIAEKEKKLFELGNIMHDFKEKCARKLESEVNEQLKDLYLENAEFKIQLTKLDNLKENGLSQALFLIKANAGNDFTSLEKTASLGETSRLNLALRTVFNAINNKSTLIFDEIDIGLSGRVAISISKKMKEISKNSQVITISHLPQVIANSDYLYLVKKEVKDEKTYSSIRLLSEEEKIVELSKMMVGQTNQSSLKAAEDLIKSFK